MLSAYSVHCDHAIPPCLFECPMEMLWAPCDERVCCKRDSIILLCLDVIITYAHSILDSCPLWPITLNFLPLYFSPDNVPTRTLSVHVVKEHVPILSSTPESSSQAQTQGETQEISATSGSINIDYLGSCKQGHKKGTYSCTHKI